MKAEVTITKRPKSGSSGESRGKLKYLDLSFDGWTADTMTNGVPLDNGRKPHGGYKGMPKHPMGIHSFNKGPDYQQQLQQVRQALEQKQHPSPTWALKVHTLPTHSGESPLFSSRLMSASKHETLNGSDRQDKASPRTTRSTTPTSKKGVSYYRPNRTHQYLSATELKDAADCEEVLRYGRPTRTTLLRARHRISSASNTSYEARRQKEQRMMENKKVNQFCTPEELIPIYSDSEEQSFYSFLTGARYNRAHCLDSKSLMRHGVYMPRNNPLGCFVLGNRADFDTASVPADSPRSDIDDAPKPQTEKPQRPTTAPNYGRRPPTRPARTPRTPRSPRTPRTAHTPRQAWGDVTVSLHIANGSRQQITLSSRDRSGRLDSPLPVVHGTSLSKLQRRYLEAQAAQALQDPSSSEALQPPPSPISARGDQSLLVAAQSPHDTLHEPTPSLTDLPARPPSPADDQQVTEQNAQATEEGENVQEKETEENETTTEEKEKGEEQKENEDGEREEEGAVEGKEGGGSEEVSTFAEKPVDNGEEETMETAEEQTEEEAQVATEGEGEDEETTAMDEDAVLSAVEAENLPAAQTADIENESLHDDTVPANDVTTSEHVTESNEDKENLDTQADVPESHNAESAKSDDIDEERKDKEMTENDEDVNFFVTEQADKTDDAGAGITRTEDGRATIPDSKPQDNKSQDNKRQAEEDTQSNASSKKSLTKRVSFKIPPVEDRTFSANEVDDADNDNVDKDLKGGRGAGRNETSDSDADDAGQSPGGSQEPLRVVVTHIEKSLGAPVSKESEGDDEVVVKDP